MVIVGSVDDLIYFFLSVNLPNLKIFGDELFQNSSPQAFFGGPIPFGHCINCIINSYLLFAVMINPGLQSFTTTTILPVD
jgi:hypothetical protein